MTTKMTYVSWLMLIVALLSWVAVVYGGMWIQMEAKERGASAMSSDERAEQAAYASRLKTVAAESKADRERLDVVSQTDIVSIANTIESAGRSVGIDARVSAAVPVGTPQEIPGGAPLQGVTFILQAEGSFSGLVQFVHVMETFPAFSTVEQLEFERISSVENRAQAWRASIRVQVLSTSDISS